MYYYDNLDFHQIAKKSIEVGMQSGIQSATEHAMGAAA